MNKRLRRYYLLLTSLALAGGAAMGYQTGQGSAEAGLTRDCIESGVFVVYDPEALEHRHFHCFELEDLEQPQESEQQQIIEYEV